MQIRIVRFESKNPLVGIALQIVVLAILAFVLTAGMALLAGGAAIGGVGYLVRRLVGGRQSSGAARMTAERTLRPEDEVFPAISPGSAPFGMDPTRAGALSRGSDGTTGVTGDTEVTGRGD